jgi:Protein of unknown function (DUF551).
MGTVWLIILFVSFVYLGIYEICLTVAMIRKIITWLKKRKSARAGTVRDNGMNDNWISVNDSTPRAFTSVLVYMPSEAPCPTVHEGFISRDGDWMSHGFRRDDGEVTHWMPMPEPTKEM